MNIICKYYFNGKILMSYPYRYAPDCLLLGQIGQSILNNLVKDSIVHIVKKHELDDLKPEEYYPVDNFINALADIANETKNATNLVAVGIAVISNMPLPDMNEWSLEQKFDLPIYSFRNTMYKDTAC